MRKFIFPLAHYGAHKFLLIVGANVLVIHQRVRVGLGRHGVYWLAPHFFVHSNNAVQGIPQLFACKVALSTTAVLSAQAKQAPSAIHLFVPVDVVPQFLPVARPAFLTGKQVVCACQPRFAGISVG